MSKKINCLGILLILVTGCSTIVERTGINITEEPSKVIKTGTTTRDEIIQVFGEPSKVTRTDESEMMIYESRKEETPSYMGGLIIGEAGKKVTLKRLEIVIRNGVALSYKFESIVE